MKRMTALSSRYLLQEIERDPRQVPEAPPYPDKSFDYE